MKKETCSICQLEQDVEFHSDWKCKQCGQGYTYKEGSAIELTKEQILALISFQCMHIIDGDDERKRWP